MFTDHIHFRLHGATHTNSIARMITIVSPNVCFRCAHSWFILLLVVVKVENWLGQHKTYYNRTFIDEITFQARITTQWNFRWSFLFAIFGVFLCVAFIVFAVGALHLSIHTSYAEL